jgi:hypothetical protein
MCAYQEPSTPSVRRRPRTLGVARQTLSRWLKRQAKALPEVAEEGLCLARPLGDQRLISLLTRACGQFEGKQGDIVTARELLTESLYLSSPRCSLNLRVCHAIQEHRTLPRPMHHPCRLRRPIVRPSY